MEDGLGGTGGWKTNREGHDRAGESLESGSVGGGWVQNRG